MLQSHATTSNVMDSLQSFKQSYPLIMSVDQLKLRRNTLDAFYDLKIGASRARHDGEQQKNARVACRVTREKRLIGACERPTASAHLRNQRSASFSNLFGIWRLFYLSVDDERRL